MEKAFKVGKYAADKFVQLAKQKNVTLSTAVEDAWRALRYYNNKGVDRQYVLKRDDEVLRVTDVYRQALEQGFPEDKELIQLTNLSVGEYELSAKFANESEYYLNGDSFTHASMVFLTCVVKYLDEGYSFMYCEGDTEICIPNALLSKYKNKECVVA